MAANWCLLGMLAMGLCTLGLAQGSYPISKAQLQIDLTARGRFAETGKILLIDELSAKTEGVKTFTTDLRCEIPVRLRVVSGKTELNKAMDRQLVQQETQSSKASFHVSGTLLHVENDRAKALTQSSIKSLFGRYSLSASATLDESLGAAKFAIFANENQRAFLLPVAKEPKGEIVVDLQPTSKKPSGNSLCQEMEKRGFELRE